MERLAELAWLACLVSVVVGVAQRFLLERHLVAQAPRTRYRKPISVLKPLCGVDDDLVENLESFLAQDYPEFELVLGVERESDPAWALAKSLAERHPGKVQAVVQRGSVGLNPKVNQLATLARVARFDWLVISDSNVRVPPISTTTR